MTGCPSFWCSPSATMRVTVSTPPPAGTQTIILIGLLGNVAVVSCASAPDNRSRVDEIRTSSARTFSSVAALNLCDSGELLCRQFQIEQPDGISAENIAFGLFAQERQI